MVSAFVSPNDPVSEQTKNWMIFGTLVIITLLRSLVLVTTPLDLGVDEAQYWLWSQKPDFGYFTKPPLIAWIIAVGHWLFGHHTWAVRLPACWIHLGTALILWQAATWLYGQRAGRLAALIWITLPATGLGSFLISTDTPLLALWSTGLLAMSGVGSGRLSESTGMLLAGLAFGLAMLAKFAAIFALAGLTLILLHSYVGRLKLFRWQDFLLALTAFVIAASPNIFWNFKNDLVSLRHLGDNANINQYSTSAAGVWELIISQFAVVGPVMFVIMLIAAISSYRNRQTSWLVWMWAPIFATMAVQSFLSEANANWTMTAFPALTLMTAAWLSNTQIRHIGTVAISVNVGLSLLLLIVTTYGSLGPLTPHSDPLRRLRGWQQLASDIRHDIAAHDTTVIIADRRATAALLSWHFYNTNLSILVHDSDDIPSNHFEANHSWSPQPGRRVIALTGATTPPSIPGVSWLMQTSTSRVNISKNMERQFTIYRGIE